MKKIVTKFLLVAVVFAAAVPLVSANTFNPDFSLNRNIKQPMLTDEILETKEFNESRAAYLSDKYGENYLELFARNAQSSKNAQKIESLFPVDKDGDRIYPNFVGGLYINDEDNLIVQIVKDAVPNVKTSEYSLYNDVLSVDKEVTIEYVKYSYAELNAVNDAIVVPFLQNKVPSSVGAFYVDVINNRIVVELLNYTEEEIAKFKNTVIDSPFITFTKGVETISTLNAGAPNTVGGSVGYRARKTSGGQGFVTHGHGLSVNNIITGIGVVRNKNFGGNIDASWVDTNGYAATPTNNWQVYPPYITPTGSLSTVVKTSFVVGERVGRVAMASGHRTGKILNANWSGQVRECSTCPLVNFTRQVSTDVYQIPGDSGGIVYYTIPPLPPFPEGHLTAGIGVFENANRMIFTRADLVNAAFGLSRY